MHLDTAILLKTENNKKIISGLLFTLKTLFICLNALFKALVQTKKKKKKRRRKRAEGKMLNVDVESK